VIVKKRHRGPLSAAPLEITMASAISTGTYDLKMLNKLAATEVKMKKGLANIWGVDDEDDLPDVLCGRSHIHAVVHN
jgi:hypothetical protein